jgi:hypothetical protein
MLETVDSKIYSSLIYVAEGVDYYLYCDAPIYDFEETQPLFVEIIFYDYSGNEVSRLSNVARNSVITIPEQCVSMRFLLPPGYEDRIMSLICINVSDPRINGTFKEPGHNNSYTLSFDEQLERYQARVDREILWDNFITLTSLYFNDPFISPLSCEYTKDINAVIGDISKLLGGI